ncbi:hypothetical protein AcV5_003515 [Taiwanofungus camphoratus]|nr:hypothetical protein AcV5_003515 [Antrodia cinnamomea]KAI0958161.1 hypothetical protein AcV7_004052 [Antrodia cinnamomea]
MDMDRTVIQTLSGETLFQAIPSAEQLQFIVASSIGSTLSTLYRLDSAELPSNSDALERGVIALLPPDAPANNRPQEEFLSALTLGANDAASSTACGSILAGQTSESDEYGDIAFWLGEGNFNKGNEKAVIKALGLQFWLSQETKVGWQGSRFPPCQCKTARN